MTTTRWCLLAVLVVVALSPEARACKCAQLSVAERVSSAVAIFEGRVRDRQEIAADADFGAVGARYDFDVTRVWKGRAAERRSITTGLSSASCGISYDVGKTYLVVASGSDEELLTDTCNGLPPWDDGAAFLQALGAPRAEFPSSRQASEPRAESRRVVVVALGAAGAALLIAWRVARRRRAAG